AGRHAPDGRQGSPEAMGHRGGSRPQPNSGSLPAAPGSGRAPAGRPRQPETGPETVAVDTSAKTRQPAPEASRAESAQHSGRPAKRSTERNRQPDSTRRGRTSGRKTGASSSAAPAIPPAAADPRDIAESPDAVTDVLAPVHDAPPKVSGKTNTSGWPTTEPVAAEPAGKTRRTRLEQSKSRRNRRLRVAGRVTLAIFAVIALLITGGAWSYLQATNNGFTQVSALDDTSEDVIDAHAQLGDENYLIVGTDTRAGANGEIGAGTVEDAEGARADTTMLVHIPQNRQRVVVVSFPRDLDVTRPECNGWDNQKPGYTEEVYPSAMGGKLNAVYALGGPKCLVSTIQRLTGSTINHFIGIDFAGFEQMVDQVGGVEVCATKPIIDGVLGPVVEQPGRHRLNGATALNYVRARHVYGEERSDYDRIARQQRFLASLLRGALSGKVLLDPGKLNGFIKAFTQATFVDRVTPNDLLMLGRSLQDVDAGAVTFLTIPTAGTTSYGNEIPRESDIKAIFRAIRDDQPLPGEKTAPAPTATSTPPPPPRYTAVDPGTLSLLVSNGSGISGLAGRTATELGSVGFGIYNTGNYTEGSAPETMIRYASGYENEAATVASAIPGATMQLDDELGSIVEVVLGENYQGIVNNPTPVGDAITDVAAASTAPVELPSDLEHVNAAEDPCA
ncbi:LCP family protein, partial [Nocardia donostiensis]